MGRTRRGARCVIHPTPPASAVPTVLPIQSNSRHDRSNIPIHELRGHSLGLLYSGLSLTERTLCAGSTSGRRATCPYSRSWSSQIMPVTDLNSSSWSNSWFVTKTFQRYPMILRRVLLPKNIETPLQVSVQSPCLTAI